jgi:two-component system, NtrC family, nitrogen regulation sensor histidine kinase NtrY
MTLALRLQIAFGLLALVATGATGLLTRTAWQNAEEDRFDQRFDAAGKGVAKLVEGEASRISDLLQATCDHNGDIDQTAMDIEQGLATGRRLAISQLVKGQMQALHLDELSLFTSTGEILGAGHDPAAVGKVDRSLVAQPAVKGLYLVVRPAGPRTKSALVARCSHTFGTQVISLLGARHLDAMLRTVEEVFDVKLSIAGNSPYLPSAHERSRTVTVPIAGLGGLRLVETLSTKTLEQHLASVDLSIILASAATVVVAILLAIWMAKGLARPLEALARQAGEVVSGEPRPVEVKGTREIVAFANAFNKALDDLVKLRKRLAVTERIAARREIARRVAHEIKNPLAPIRAAVETLRRLRSRNDPAFDDYFDEATKTVLSEVHRITKIVSEFTEFARLPAPHPTSVDIEEVAKSTVALYATGGAEVSLHASSCPIIQADRDQIVQVLTNLIQNGLDATAGEGPKVDVRIEPLAEGRVAIRVADNGPGVSEEMLPKLFLPYATSKPSGTGLGLAIVQRIVHEHGGEITYEKGAAGGAVFRVVLPVAGPTLPVTSSEETPESQPEPRG